MDADLVGNILQLTFPDLYDQKAIGQADSMFNKPKEVQPRRGQKISGVKFWTSDLINKFLYRRYGGQDQTYDNYFQQGMTEQRAIMQRIKVNRSQAFNSRFNAKPNDPRILTLFRSIKEDEMKLEKIKSRTSEQAFNTRNDVDSVNAQIDLHG